MGIPGVGVGLDIDTCITNTNVAVHLSALDVLTIRKELITFWTDSTSVLW